MNKTKIIVVEDNIVYCEYVCNMLSREGYRNMKAYHLSTAKKHLQQATDNDIVVADLRLPDGSGIDLLCWMRKEGKMQPFIIMTDYAEVNTAVESMKLGSIDYIPKQLVEDKLVPLIRSILKERQAGQRRMPIFAREGSAFQSIWKQNYNPNSNIRGLSKINRVVLTNSMEVRKKGWQKLLLAIFVRMIHWMRNVLYLELSASKVFGDLENPTWLKCWNVNYQTTITFLSMTHGDIKRTCNAALYWNCLQANLLMMVSYLEMQQ